MNEAPSFAVVVPFFNEERSVDSVCAELRRVLTDELSGAEVVLIDDGSTDGTGARLSKIAAAWPAARVFRFRENRGQSAALLFGFSNTIAPIVVTMDGDGQNDPHDIRRLLARLAEADMVVGARVERQDSWMRRKISRIANHIRSDLLGDGVSDSGCALKVFRREVVSAFIPIRTLYSFMPALAVAAGFHVVEEPVHHRPRQHGESKYSVTSFLFLPIVDFIGLRWFRSRRCRDRPLPRPNERSTIGTPGTDRYRRGVRPWMGRVALVLALGLFVCLLLGPRKSSVGPAARKINLERAEHIALHLVPKGQLESEELSTENGRLTYKIDIQLPGAKQLREVEIDALDGRVIASRIETAEEEALEVAVTNHHRDPKHPFRQ